MQIMLGEVLAVVHMVDRVVSCEAHQTISALSTVVSAGPGSEFDAVVQLVLICTSPIAIVVR